MQLTQNRHLEQVVANISRWDILKHAISYLIITLLLEGSFLYYLLNQSHENKLTALKTEEKEKVDLSRALTTRDLEIVASDLRILADSNELTQYLNEINSVNLQALTERFSNFAHDRRLYDQVRFIDVHGKERVRINTKNGQVERVTGDALQNKSNRYYFRDSINLSPGEIYVSPLDLNIERNEIEFPHKPMLRVATPAISNDSNVLGIVILNYQAGRLLNRIKAWVPSDLVAQRFILNSQGYWLDSPNEELRWGFMFGSNKTFAHNHPDLWAKMRTRESGQIQTTTGIYTFTTVYPKVEMNLHTRSIERANQLDGLPDSRAWILVSHISSERLQLKPFNVDNHGLWFSFSVILGLSLVIIWLKAKTEYTERELQKSFMLLVAGLEQSPNAALITSKLGTIEYVNPAFTELTGYSYDEAVGSNPRMLKSGDQHHDPSASLWQTITQGGHWQGEYHNRHKDGDTYWVSVRVSPITNPKGEITHFIGIQEDITEQKQLHEQLELMSKTDLLTNVHNRRHFFESTQVEMARAQRNSRSLSMMMIDVDHFKRINDRYGHQAGDTVLKQIAQVLKENLRLNDLLARYGGEEFVITLPETTISEAAHFAERIRLAIEESQFGIDEDSINVTVSIGCASLPIGSLNLSKMIERADIAMYQAKANGRNRVEIAQGSKRV